MKTVLFLCSGNYYRSRFAEILFNWRAAQRGIPWRAVSRALNPSGANIGPISRYTLEALAARGVQFDEIPRRPIVATAADFTADRVIAVKETEHRPLVERLFPAAAAHVEYWNVHDLDCAPPEEAIPLLEQHVEQLLNEVAPPPAGDR